MNTGKLITIGRYIELGLTIFLVTALIGYPRPKTENDIPGGLRNLFNNYFEKQRQLLPKGVTIPIRQQGDKGEVGNNYQQQQIILSALSSGNNRTGDQYRELPEENSEKCKALLIQLSERITTAYTNGDLDNDTANFYLDLGRRYCNQNKMGELTELLKAVSHPNYLYHLARQRFHTGQPYAVIRNHQNGIVEGVLVDMFGTTQMAFTLHDDLLPPTVQSQLHSYDLGHSFYTKRTYICLAVMLFIIGSLNTVISLRQKRPPESKKADAVGEFKLVHALKIESIRLKRNKWTDSRNGQGDRWHKKPYAEEVALSIVILASLAGGIAWGTYANPEPPAPDKILLTYIDKSLDAGTKVIISDFRHFELGK
jgi:hypothetical protein